jgi:hypothetical protein
VAKNTKPDGGVSRRRFLKDGATVGVGTTGDAVDIRALRDTGVGGEGTASVDVYDAPP